MRFTICFLISWLSSTLAWATPATYDAMAKIRNCSASVIQFDGQADSDKVLLLTNGHCIHHQLDTIDAIVNQPYVDFANLYRGNTPLIVGSLAIDRIIYATLTNTDIAILQATATYQELKTLMRVSPRHIAPSLPTVGEQVNIASGNLEQTYHCHVDKIVDTVQESKWQWHMVTRLANSPSCRIKAGSSGSPVINEAGQIVALINTGNTEGHACTLDNPCEIDTQGHITIKLGASYAVDTSMLNMCFPNGLFTFPSSCPLTRPQIHSIHTLPLFDPRHPRQP